MPATRIRAAAVQALQTLLLLLLCLLPLWPLWWAIFSIFGVLTVARGLRNTDSYPGPHWLKWPLAVVSLPLKLAAGLAWTLYVRCSDAHHSPIHTPWAGAKTGECFIHPRI